MNEQSSKILRAFFRENGFKNERNLIDNGLLNISNLKLLTNKKSINNNYINQKFFFENFFMKESENFFDGIVILLDLYNLTLHCKDSYFFKILPFIKVSASHRGIESEKHEFYNSLMKIQGFFNKAECNILDDFIRKEKLLVKPKDKQNYYKLVTQKFPHELWEDFGISKKEENSITVEDSIWININKDSFLKQCNLSLICEISEYTEFIENAFTAMKDSNIISEYFLKKFGATNKDACLVCKTNNKQKVIDSFNYLLKHSHETDLSLEKMSSHQRILYMKEALEKYFNYVEFTKFVNDVEPNKKTENIKKNNIKI